MSKKDLILSGSPRRNGNSDLLCDEFLRGARESGNQAEKIFLRSKKVAPCNACYTAAATAVSVRYMTIWRRFWTRCRRRM